MSDCQACLKMKPVRKNFPKKAESTITELLQRVDSDVVGPMRTRSKGGKRFFITFTDIYTRKTKLYFMAKKSEALECFKHYQALVENQFETSIKELRTDGGGEYCNRAFRAYLDKLGVEHEVTPPYTPQYNGIAERINRTLMEMARAMLSQAGLPHSFWAEAVVVACYLKNKCPHSALDGKTPE